MQRRDLPEGWDRELPVFAADPKGIAGRDASGAALNAIARNVPWFLGGSADVGPSNRTTLKFAGAGDFQAPSPGGRNLHFGIREHAMAAITNGLALSKLRPFAATYFIFSDYARPALRLAALIRRNWHLLPYEQLLELLDMTPEQLAFTLREDDFLFSKLGSLKPKCEPLHYAKPDAAAKRRAAEIKQVVAKDLGDDFLKPGEPRFQFLQRFNKTSAKAPENAAKTPAAVVSDDAPVRFIYSYFAVYGDPLSNPKLDPYPDGLLERLSAMGVNGVWLHVVLRVGAGRKRFPEFGEGCEKRLANLKTLVERAKQYGIGVYLYMNEPRAMPSAFFKNRPELAGVQEDGYVALCTSQPAVRRWISDALAHVFREVPDLAGVFTISASENLTNCASHYQWKSCPHCKNRTDADILAEVNATIAEGVHRGNPKAKVIVWDWGWRGNADASDVIARLPKSVQFMSVSEWDLPIERGGIRSAVSEYSLSSVGPGPRALRHWKAAQAAGLKTVAKVQMNNTWEFSTVPYLPVMNLVAEHCHNLAAAGVEGKMLSWSLGGYPSPNLEIAARFCEKPTPTIDAVLDAVAKERFGDAGAPLARKAWTAFSTAFREFPYSCGLYTNPMQMGPANPLYLKPTGYRATMVGIPYDDLHMARRVSVGYFRLAVRESRRRLAVGHSRFEGGGRKGSNRS